MLPAERRNDILKILKKNGTIIVSELSSHFNVSEGTIRRDLNILANKGLLEKTYGGAIFSKVGFEPSFQVQKTISAKEKEAIGIQAAKLIENGDTIFLDSGTTGLYMAKALKDLKNIIVVTNGVEVAAELLNYNGIDLMMTGGDVRKLTSTMVGPLTLRVLSEIRVDKVFLGISGISVERGMTTGTMVEAEVKKAIINCGKEVIGLADSTKFHIDAFVSVAPVTALDTLVTDNKITPDVKGALEELGVEVIEAKV